MSQLTINNGTFDNDSSAESVRSGFGKVNTMFTELFSKIPLEFPLGVEGYIIKVKQDRTGFEIVALGGGGDVLASNNLSDLTDASQARNNLGLGSAAESDSTDFATSTQGTAADSALQSIQAGAGISIDITNPNSPVIINNETNDYVNGVSFAPLTGVLTLSLFGGGSVTVDLSAYTILKIDGFEVKKGTGNTNDTAIEVGDYCKGWDGDNDVAFKVNALPHTTEANRSYATNNSF